MFRKSRGVEIIDWRDIEKDDRQGLGKAPLINDLEQGILFAKKLGKSKTECAEEIGISRTGLYRWLSGEDFPDDEYEQKIRKWLFGLRDLLLRQPQAGKTTLRHATESSETIPKVKRSEKQTGVEKKGVAPSQKIKDLTVKTLMFNKDDSEKD